jgi:hypothetical protein
MGISARFGVEFKTPETVAPIWNQRISDIDYSIAGFGRDRHKPIRESKKSLGVLPLSRIHPQPGKIPGETELRETLTFDCT